MFMLSNHTSKRRTYNGAKNTTTNTGTRNANAVGVMPDCPTVFCHSLFSNPRTSYCDDDTAGITKPRAQVGRIVNHSSK